MRGPNNNTHLVHDAGRTWIKNKTASKRHSTWMSSWPELQSGGEKIYLKLHRKACSAPPIPSPWAIYTSSEIWLGASKDFGDALPLKGHIQCKSENHLNPDLRLEKTKRNGKNLEKRHTIASTLAWLLHCFVCCQQSRCVHPKHLTLAGVRCPLLAGNRCQSCWKNPWKVRFKKITKVLVAAIWPVQP